MKVEFTTSEYQEMELVFSTMENLNSISRFLSPADSSKYINCQKYYKKFNDILDNYSNTNFETDFDENIFISKKKYLHYLKIDSYICQLNEIPNIDVDNAYQSDLLQYYYLTCSIIDSYRKYKEDLIKIEEINTSKFIEATNNMDKVAELEAQIKDFRDFIKAFKKIGKIALIIRDGDVHNTLTGLTKKYNIKMK